MANRLVARGVTLLQRGKPAEARRMFETASAAVPGDARIWFALAGLSETPAAAVELLRRAVGLDPAHQRARLLLVKHLAALAAQASAAGDRDQARLLLIEACAFDSSNVDVLMARARLEQTSGADVRFTLRLAQWQERD